MQMLDFVAYGVYIILDLVLYYRDIFVVFAVIFVFSIIVSLFRKTYSS